MNTQEQELPSTLSFRYSRKTISGNSAPVCADVTKDTGREIGMKLSKVRIGERFVFDDRGGVWEKIAEGKARCFFGAKDMWNKEIDIPADGYCYIPSFDPRSKTPREGEPVAGPSTGTKIRIVDDTNEVMLREIEAATADQVAILGSVRVLRLTLFGKTSSQQYSVDECRYDLDDGTFYVMVTPEESVHD